MTEPESSLPSREMIKPPESDGSMMPICTTKPRNNPDVDIPQPVSTGTVPSLVGLVSQITSENRHDEVSAGPERGQESVEWRYQK